MAGISDSFISREPRRDGGQQQEAEQGGSCRFFPSLDLSDVLGGKDESRGLDGIRSAPELARDVVIEAAEKASEAWAGRLNRLGQSRRSRDAGENKGGGEEKSEAEQGGHVQLAVLPFSADCIVAVSQVR